MAEPFLRRRSTSATAATAAPSPSCCFGGRLSHLLVFTGVVEAPRTCAVGVSQFNLFIIGFNVSFDGGVPMQSSQPVRGLCIATGQYSSFCGCALGLVLGGFDHMEVEVQDREKVEVRETVRARETEEEDKTRKQQTLKHVMTCG